MTDSESGVMKTEEGKVGSAPPPDNISPESSSSEKKPDQSANNPAASQASVSGEPVSKDSTVKVASTTAAISQPPASIPKPETTANDTAASSSATPAPATPSRPSVANASTPGSAMRTPGGTLMTKDQQETVTLKRAIDTLGLFHTREDLVHREEVLATLTLLARRWVAKTLEEKGIPNSETGGVGAKLFTYGSYRLGVFNAESDIDCLIVGPRDVNKRDFMATFPDVLRSRPEATMVNPVEEAFVPVIKIVFDGIELDLQYAALPMTTIPDDLSLKGDGFMKTLVACPDWQSVVDFKTIRSLNGTRDTDMLLEVVPDRETYRLALRLLRVWAKERGVYGNKVGYPGGFAWSVMLARVCQMFPTLCAAGIMKKFFKTMLNWAWAPSKPIILCDLKRQEDVFGSKISDETFSVWGDTPLKEQGNLMPVITPAFPAMNSTFNVTKATKTMMLSEFKRGLKILEEGPVTEESWYKLCERTNFFSCYKHFFRIDIFARTEEKFSQWKGFVEAKLRFISLAVEDQCEGMVAQPFQEPFHPQDVTEIPGVPPPFPSFTATYFLGLKRIDSKVSYTLEQLCACSEKFLNVIVDYGKHYEEEKYITFRPTTREEIPATVRKENAQRASVKPSLYAKKRHSSITPETPLKKR